ncbi:MAG: hypothetical protein DI595_00050 [Agrobacterium fabrum]|uniref:Uncharacterized protein n=1 Tax=Agrobacterium fabrum TaxID=1176649 RepID=A0A2W5H8H2_9HYPH|nr:MAG: hypothetical protein DI595_00050 [Agrobacterium fabrum]
MTALYTSGTISLVNGSAVINGIDTAWKTALIVGGTVHVEAEGNPLPILADDSAGASEHPITDTQMTAAIKWQGATGTYKYALVRENTYTTAQAENSTKIAELLRRLNNPTLAALAGIEAEQDHLILLTGESTATIIPRSSLIQGVEANAKVETPAGLSTYESEAAGFIVLVSNAGNQRAALYFKKSATAGDWSAPAYLTGAQGIQGEIGPTGITWRSTWNGAVAYAKNDLVRSNKSAWIALRANTNVAPPVLPTTANADWELFAPAGLDGTGTGDVRGPGAAVAGAIAQFATVDGREITTAQIGSRALLGRYSAGVGPVERLGQAEIREIVGGWEFVKRVEIPANQSIVNVLSLGSFAALRMFFCFISNGSSNTGIQLSPDNGSTFRGDNDEYAYVYEQSNGTSSPVSGAGTSYVFPLTGDHSGATGWQTISEVLIHSFNTSGRNASGLCTNYMQQPAGHQVRTLGASSKRAEAYNAFRLVNLSSTFQYGYIDIEGIRA